MSAEAIPQPGNHVDMARGILEYIALTDKNMRAFAANRLAQAGLHVRHFGGFSTSPSLFMPPNDFSFVETIKDINLKLREIGGLAVMIEEEDGTETLIQVDGWLGRSPVDPNSHVWHPMNAPPSQMVQLHEGALDEMRELLEQPSMPEHSDGYL